MFIESKCITELLIKPYFLSVCVCKTEKTIWNDSLRDDTMRLMPKKDVQLKKKKNREAESLLRRTENAKHTEESVHEVWV